MQSVFRTPKTRNFVTVTNDFARNKKLSLEARGFMLMVLSLPPDWEFSFQWMLEEAACGKDKLRRVLGELEEAGYMRKAVTREGGRFAADYEFFEESAEPESRSGSAGAVQPERFSRSGKPATVYIEDKNVLTNTDLQKTEPLKRSKSGNEAQAPAQIAPESLIPDLSKHPAIQAVRSTINRYPNKITWPAIVESLRENPDLPRLKECAAAWIARGFNPVNLGWIHDWYVNGIPADVKRRETIAEHNARTTDSFVAKMTAKLEGIEYDQRRFSAVQ